MLHTHPHLLGGIALTTTFTGLILLQALRPLAPWVFDARRASPSTLGSTCAGTLIR
jgi:hypothetical protein